MMKLLIRSSMSPKIQQRRAKPISTGEKLERGTKALVKAVPEVIASAGRGLKGITENLAENLALSGQNIPAYLKGDYGPETEQRDVFIAANQLENQAAVEQGALSAMDLGRKAYRGLKGIGRDEPETDAEIEKRLAEDAAVRAQIAQAGRGEVESNPFSVIPEATAEDLKAKGGDFKPEVAEGASIFTDPTQVALIPVGGAAAKLARTPIGKAGIAVAGQAARKGVETGGKVLGAALRPVGGALKGVAQSSVL
jgi:hypothetical protein